MTAEEALDEYSLSHIDGEGELLARLSRDTHIHSLRPRMMSGHLQGRILKMICRMQCPRRILEIGTFTGYSTLCLAEGMPADAELHTVAIDDEIEDFTRQHLALSPFADRIHLHMGDAFDVVPRLGGSFDLVYIDADKRRYSDYYDMVFDRVVPGGMILADNTLWDHKVCDGHSHDTQTLAVMAFNDKIATDTRVEKVILPLRDGLTLIWKKQSPSRF